MRYLFIAFAAFFVNRTSAQGCSDAGFCSIGNLDMAPSGNAKMYRQSIKLLLPVGLGDQNVFVFAPGIEYTNDINKFWQVQAKVTANYASGNLGSATGPGDLYLSATKNFHPQAKWKTSFTLGTKLPLNNGNVKEGGKSLPMQYQSSLGTIDLITGLSIASDQWQFAAGWQQPLSGRNRNNFLPAYWSNTDANAYAPSNDFNRKADVLLRASYKYAASKKMKLDGGLLGIYHLFEDSYINANTSNKPIAIVGSRGLTLNITGALRYDINNRVQIGFTGGVPIVVRDVRPDGLTRHFVLAPQISFKF